MIFEPIAEEQEVPQVISNRSRPRSRRFRDFMRFLRELSVVAAGVAITFIVSGWVSSVREKKELHGHLEAVKMELEANLEMLEERLIYYNTMYELATYLTTDLPENHFPDLIWEVSLMPDGTSVLKHHVTFPVQTSSFETLKASGTMNLIGDQELLRSMLQSYKMLEDIKEESNAYMARKQDIYFRTIIENKLVLQERINLTYPALLDLFYYHATHNNLNVTVGYVLGQVGETIELFQ